MKFDLRNGFPLLTTKKMFLRGIIEEFLFFLRGDTDSTILSEKGIRIWEKNTSDEFISSLGLPYAKGVMGPMYGYQWRFYNAEYTLANGRPTNKQGINKEGINKEGIDQLADVVHLIKNDPTSRRILMTTYNPEQASLGVLYPCHSITIQFYVQNEFLDMFCYNRSQDFFLGVPFNIAPSSLLLMIVAKLTNKTPRFFYITMGDSHIYSEHISQVEMQIKRMPFAFPTLQIPDIKELKEIDSLTAKDFILSDYKFHSQIQAEMIA
jgi:dihydrofolate reductase/thymidylate synthase